MKKKFKILDMHCSSCALTIDMDLEDLSGIKSAKTSYTKQECEIEFEDGKIDIEKIVLTIRNTGYRAQLKTDE